jgi:hypothetical protein
VPQEVPIIITVSDQGVPLVSDNNDKASAICFDNGGPVKVQRVSLTMTLAMMMIVSVQQLRQCNPELLVARNFLLRFSGEGPSFACENDQPKACMGTAQRTNFRHAGVDSGTQSTHKVAHFPHQITINKKPKL